MKPRLVLLSLLLLPLGIARAQGLAADPAAVRANTIFVDAAAAGTGERGTGKAFATLQAAVAVARAGDTLEIRPGTYFCDTLWQWEVPLHVIGYRAKLTTTANDANLMVRLSGSAHGSTVEGLELDGKRTTATGTGNGAIEIYGCTDVTFENIYVHDHQSPGVRFIGATHRGTVRHSRFEQLAQGVVAVMAGDDVPTNLSITDNVFKDGLFDDTGGGGSQAIAIHRDGFSKLEASSGHTVTGNVISGWSYMGIELWGGHANVDVSRNQISHGNFLISFNACRNATANDNRLSGPFGYCGIEFAGSTGSASRNRIDGGPTPGGVALIADGPDAIGVRFFDNETRRCQPIVVNNESAGTIIEANRFDVPPGHDGAYVHNGPGTAFLRNQWSFGGANVGIGFDVVNGSAGAGVRVENETFTGTIARAVLNFYMSNPENIPGVSIRNNDSRKVTGFTVPGASHVTFSASSGLASPVFEGNRPLSANRATGGTDGWADFTPLPPTGTTAGTVAAGNDARFPLAASAEQAANKGAARGSAPLDESSKVPASHLPAILYAATSTALAVDHLTPDSFDVPGMSLGVPEVPVVKHYLATFTARASTGTGNYVTTAFVTGSNVNTSPGNSGLIDPPSYASPDTGSTPGYHPYGNEFWFHKVTTVLAVPANTSRVKIVSAPRGGYNTNIWYERSFTLTPID